MIAVAASEVAVTAAAAKVEVSIAADETAGVEADVTNETGAAEEITFGAEGNKGDVVASPLSLSLVLTLIGSCWHFSFECKKPGIYHHFTFGFAHGEAVLPSLARINGIAPRPLWYFIWISAVVFWEVSAKALKVFVFTN